jgi:hypothetical protein
MHDKKAVKWTYFEKMCNHNLFPVVSANTEDTVRSKIKKIEMAMINTFQLAVRKNLIQMSSDVNSNCHSGVSRHLSTTCLDYFVFSYLKNNVFKNRPGTIRELMQVITDNCNLIYVPGPDFAKVMKRKE